MAIKKKNGHPADTPRGRREILEPFLVEESGIHALRSFIGNDSRMQREGMYLLEILNNLIQSNNGTTNLYQRIPPEVRGGLHEGGRRNVQASLIQRAVFPESQTSQEGSRDAHGETLGYTPFQQIIGSWAERDGSWSDTPEGDIARQGYENDPDADGSEARVFKKEGDKRLIKTIDCSHFLKHNEDGSFQPAFELQIDRINIHNATFPHAALRVEGLGVRDDSDDNTGFVVVVSQPVIDGETPTREEIINAMYERGYEPSSNGFWFVSKLDNTILADIHEGNCLRTPQGRVAVYDCDAMLKVFPVEPDNTKEIDIKRLLPINNGRHDTAAWREVFGPEADRMSEQEKSQITRTLLYDGTLKNPVNGILMMMKDDSFVPQKDAQGKTQLVHTGKVTYGHPEDFQKEHVYRVPELKYEPQASEEIRRTIMALAPITYDNAKEFLDSVRYVVKDGRVNYLSDTEKKELLQTLHQTGHVEGLVNGRYIVQYDKPSRQYLSNESENIAFMLWTKDCPLDDGRKLTREDKAVLANGMSLTKGKDTYRFDLDKGRVDKTTLVQQKKRLTETESIEKTKKKRKAGRTL